MKKIAQIIFIGIGAVGLVVLGFGAGFSVGKEQGTVIPIEGAINLTQDKPAAADFSLFWRAWGVIQNQFADRNELNQQNMMYGAISGMVESLGDEYTVFMTPDESKKFLEDVSGTFEGVGMEVGMRDGQLKVIAPLEKSPAQKAGIMAGDTIVNIDDTSTENISLDQAIFLIRGPKGTNVRLLIMRQGFNQPKEFVIKRDVIEVPSLKWELKDKVAYIHLYQFSDRVVQDFRKAASQILSSGADRIVLDLRNNPGGYLQAAQDIAGWFLKDGQTVVIEDFKAEGKQEPYAVEGDGAFLHYPMVVLMNQGSASASEILAGAIRDNRGIMLIGEQSFGKGSVQELVKLQDSSTIKVTVARWLTPKGNQIDGKGLKPDIEVKITEEDSVQGKDPQLEKALEVVKDL
ncbi:MAG: S41 family peptidase [Candidatus Wildermuthbacteria bacterium]|nr:S41 family peptidase [Candidatus Wildermuthbacteria bacterium]